MTLPVVWLPEADADLKESRAWYDNVRSELGERFAYAIEGTVETISEGPLQFPVGSSKTSSCWGEALSFWYLL
jgi:hypothetical protein